MDKSTVEKRNALMDAMCDMFLKRLKRVRRMGRTWGYVVAGLLITAFFLTFIELHRPYHFTRDDNFDQFLPVMLEGLHQLEDGYLPVLNTHQLAGVPLLEMGTYPVFYPITLLSYGITQVIGNEQALIDVFVILHIFAGFLLAFWLLRKKDVPPWIAMLGGLAWAFSGYALIESREWFYVAPTLIFLPALILAHDWAVKKNALLPTIIWGLLRAVYFYSGNMQYFLYTCFFELLYVLLQWNREGRSWKRLESYGLSLVTSIILMAPLILSLREMLKASAVRSYLHPFKYIFSLGSQPWHVLKGLLLPYPLVSMPANYFALAPPSLIQLHYTGYLFGWAFLIGGIITILKHKWLTVVKANAFFVLGVLAYWLSLGINGGLYALFVIVPYWNKLLLPFKLTIYGNFFVILFGAIVFSTWIAKKSWNSAKVRALIIALFLLLLVWHVNVSKDVANVCFPDTVPATWNVPIDLEDGRVFTVLAKANAPNIDCNRPFEEGDVTDSLFMNYDFATMFGAYSLTGYETLRSTLSKTVLPTRSGGLYDTEINVAGASEYGVKWFFVPTRFASRHQELAGLPVAYTDKTITIIENPNARPLVFAEKSPIDYDIQPNGVSFTTDFAQSERVTINFIAEPKYDITIDGAPACWQQDSYGRITLIVPAGAHRVEARYVLRAFWQGIAILMIGLLVIAGYAFFRKPMHAVLDCWEKRATNWWKKAPKKKIFLVIGIFLLLVIGFAFFRTFINTNILESTIGARMEQTFSIGDAQYSPDGTIILSNILLDNPAGFAGRLLKADRAMVQVDIPAGISKRSIPPIKDVTIDGLELNMVSHGGIANMVRLTTTPGTPVEGEAPAKSAAFDDTARMSRLTLNDARITYTHDDLQKIIGTNSITIEGDAVFQNATFIYLYNENKIKKRLHADHVVATGTITVKSVEVPFYLEGDLTDAINLDVTFGSNAFDAVIAAVANELTNECVTTLQSDCYVMDVSFDDNKWTGMMRAQWMSQAPLLWTDAKI